MNTQRVLTMVAIMGVMLATGCNRYHVIPDDLKGTVNRGVNFDQVKSSPSSYQGEVIVLGGEILSAKRLEDKTLIEVLQLPLKDDLTPTTERTESKGRFVAFDSGTEIVDPAILKEGTPVTIIGEVKPPTKGHVGESQYEFPTLAIRDMTVWNKNNTAAGGNRYYAYPAYGSYGYGYGYRPYNFMTGSRVREETRTSP
ncbi:MAG TPA: Slp family lipoprotein [Nitrospiraceae bacterium]|nr:Slp family lipoprotein [Nitrospiraceae bacterium]